MVFVILRSLSSNARNIGIRNSQRIMSDDITALLTGFGKFNLNRRKLSVICDDDDGPIDRKFGPRSDLLNCLETVIEYKKRGVRVSGVVLEKSVRDLCTIYNEVEPAKKFDFLENLSKNYGVHKAYVNQTASAILASNEEPSRLKLEDELRSALVPDYHWLFSQIGKLDNGVKFLVDLRSDMIDYSRSNKSDYLIAMSENLKDLISMWFSIGFLKLERITWGSSSDMLQKISEYEAVHPMRNWTDLKRRVGPYRRCFVFTHGSMPNEPVVVLHTALTQSIASRISSIVKSSQLNSVDSNNSTEHTVEDANLCDTAIFYSITSTQKGLLGIELGNFLIKRVVKILQAEFPKMKRYSSLSPIPGFKNWLLTSLMKQQKLLTEPEEQELKKILSSSDEDLYPSLIKVLESNSYIENEAMTVGFEKVLMRLCAVYLVETKRHGYAFDPVAHFHLKNGAVMWRINWLGDLSPKGLNQSCGIMVNYRYFLEDCDRNSQEYVENQHLTASELVENLLK